MFVIDFITSGMSLPCTYKYHKYFNVSAARSRRWSDAEREHSRHLRTEGGVLRVPTLRGGARTRTQIARHGCIQSGTIAILGICKCKCNYIVPFDPRYGRSKLHSRFFCIFFLFIFYFVCALNYSWHIFFKLLSFSMTSCALKECINFL